MTLQAAPTARESVEAAFDEVVKDDAPIPAQETLPAEPDASTATTEAKSEAPAQESEAERAERLRNKDGTFAKGKPEPKVADPAKPVAPKVPRPSSWKKELEPQWETLAPELQAYVQQREKEYQTGVSTYKSEADRAKGVMEALSRFEPILQQHNIPVDKWITNLGNAHHTLSLGTQQQKVDMVASVIRNNNIDAQALFQVLSGQQPVYQQQPQQQQQQPQQPALTPETIRAQVRQEFMSRDVNQQYEAFTKAKDEAGNPKYPHQEEVKGTMAALLEANIPEISDYPSAYEASLAMPKHRHLVTAAQPQPAPTPAAQQAATVARARSQAVSVKSSTPSTMTQAQGPKGLRDQLSEAFDSVNARRV